MLQATKQFMENAEAWAPIAVSKAKSSSLCTVDGACCISNSCETILNKEKAAIPFSSQHMAFLQVIHRLFIGK